MTLRFETDCGPDDDTSYDWSFWSDRVIELPGHDVPLPVLTDPPALDLTRLSSRANGDVTPLSANDGEHRVTFDTATHEARLRYLGADGELLYCWRPPQERGDPPLGQWTLQATVTGGQPVEIPLATGNRIEWTEPAQVDATDVRVEDNMVRCHGRWRVGDLEANLVIEARLVGKSIVLEIACDQPVITQLQAGSGVWNRMEPDSIVGQIRPINKRNKRRRCTMGPFQSSVRLMKPTSPGRKCPDRNGSSTAL